VIDSDDENADKKDNLPGYKLAQNRSNQNMKARKKAKRRRVHESDSEDEADMDASGDVDMGDFIVPDNVTEYNDGTVEVDPDVAPQSAAVVRAQQRELDRSFQEEDDEDMDMVFDEDRAKMQCIDSAASLLNIRDEFMQNLSPTGCELLLNVASDKDLNDIGNDCSSLDFKDVAKVHDILDRCKKLHTKIERQQGPILREVKEDLCTHDTKIRRVTELVDTYTSEGPLVVCSCFLRTLHVLEGHLARRGRTFALFRLA